MINLSHQFETAHREAKKCAERAMSLKPEIAKLHAETYFSQQRPRGLLLEDVVTIFQDTFAEKREEETALDAWEDIYSYDEE